MAIEIIHAIKIKGKILGEPMSGIHKGECENCDKPTENGIVFPAMSTDRPAMTQVILCPTCNTERQDALKLV